jgi:hypothetical protein
LSREPREAAGPCIRASGTRVPPLPLPATRVLEDVRGVETTEKLG